jgi:hypothetical protein
MFSNLDKILSRPPSEVLEDYKNSILEAIDKNAYNAALAKFKSDVDFILNRYTPTARDSITSYVFINRPFYIVNTIDNLVSWSPDSPSDWLACGNIRDIKYKGKGRPPIPRIMLEYEGFSREALYLIAKYVFTKYNTKSIQYKYDLKITLTNTTTKNIIYSHYLKDDYGRYSKKLYDVIPESEINNLLPDCAISLPPSQSTTNEEEYSFEVSIVVTWRIHPTIVFFGDNALEKPPYVDLNPNVVFLDYSANNTKMTINVPQPLDSQSYSLDTNYAADNKFLDYFIKNMNSKYKQFLNQFYYEEDKELSISDAERQEVRPQATKYTCKDKCDREQELTIASFLASPRDYYLLNQKEKTIKTTKCVEYDNNNETPLPIRKTLEPSGSWEGLKPSCVKDSETYPNCEISTIGIR